MMKNLIKSNENAGFSLVELIVVIAIMAVMTSVLAPSLLGYVEQSRMQKDDSAMGEVNNAIKLALADQNVYDECLAYNVINNYSCYVDDTNKGKSEGNGVTADVAVTDKQVGNAAAFSVSRDANNVVDSWHLNDSMRLDDETPYYPAGNMRGMTITFTSDGGTNDAVFALGNARINNIGNPNTARTLLYKYNPTTADITLSKMTSKGGVAADTDSNAGKLYNRLRATVGDSITLSSQTYRNSEYTVFIRMGSMGGNNAASQDAVAVYGQWSGTNLEG